MLTPHAYWWYKETWKAKTALLLVNHPLQLALGTIYVVKNKNNAGAARTK
jgi:hypothetical protein